jgi:hypothetical protein
MVTIKLGGINGHTLSDLDRSPCVEMAMQKGGAMFATKICNSTIVNTFNFTYFLGCHARIVSCI